MRARKSTHLRCKSCPCRGSPCVLMSISFPANRVPFCSAFPFPPFPCKRERGGSGLSEFAAEKYRVYHYSISPFLPCPLAIVFLPVPGSPVIIIPGEKFDRSAAMEAELAAPKPISAYGIGPTSERKRETNSRSSEVRSHVAYRHACSLAAHRSSGPSVCRHIA